MPATTDDEIDRMVERRWGGLIDMVNAAVIERDAAGTALPAEFLAAAGATGLLSYSLPTSIGGGGADPVAWGMVLEAIGRRCEDVAFPLLVSIRPTIARLLCDSSDPSVRDAYVLPIARGELAVAAAFTEDADVFAMETFLRGPIGRQTLAGRKSYVSGATLADVFLTYALDDTGDMCAVLVHRDDPGVEVVPVASIGHRSSGAGALVLTDVPIDASRIAAPSDGLTHAQRFLNDRRLLICCAPLGRAQTILERCVARTSTTSRYGQRIADMQNVQATLGRMYIAIEASRATLYRALRREADGLADPLFDPIVSAAKYFVSEQVRYVLDQAMRILGGHGYYGDLHYGRYLRDFAGLVAAAGTQDILEVNLGALAVSRYAPHSTSKEVRT